MIDDDEFCLALNNGIFVGPIGNLNFCCYNSNLKFINENSNIIEEYNSPETKSEIDQGWKKSKRCHTCKNRESLGLYSFRHIANSYTPKDYIVDNNNRKLLLLDINFSNLCNQKCIMCNSNFSTKWLADDIEITKSPDVEKLRWKNLNPKYKRLTDLQLNQILELVDHHTIKMWIKGGEPFLDDRLIPFIKKIQDRSPTIQSEIITNGTMMTDLKINELNLLNPFAITISIDGVGNTYSFIRNFEWNTIDKNFQNLMEKLDKKHLIGIQITVSRYNVDKLTDIIEWVESIELKYDRKVMINITMVNYPNYLQAKYASNKILKRGLRQIIQIKKDGVLSNRGKYFDSKCDSLTKLYEDCLKNRPKLEDQKENDRLANILSMTRSNNFKNLF